MAQCGFTRLSISYHYGTSYGAEVGNTVSSTFWGWNHNAGLLPNYFFLLYYPYDIVQQRYSKYTRATKEHVIRKATYTAQALWQGQRKQDLEGDLPQPLKSLFLCQKSFRGLVRFREKQCSTLQLKGKTLMMAKAKCFYSSKSL